MSALDCCSDKSNCETVKNILPMKWESITCASSSCCVIRSSSRCVRTALDCCGDNWYVKRGLFLPSDRNRSPARHPVSVNGNMKRAMIIPIMSEYRSPARHAVAASGPHWIAGKVIEM